MTDTNVMRTIKFTTVQGIQKPLKLKESGTIFALYSTNRIFIRPGKNAEIKT